MRRNATLFVLISLLDGFGSTAMGISAGLWLLDLTHSVALASLAGICTYAPVFLGPWLGAAVDRLPRRPLMVTAEATIGLLLLTLLTVRSATTAWLVFAVLLARGIGGALVDAGETAILPSALPPAALGSVNGWRSSALEGTKLLAPVAGAGLYAWQGPAPVVLLCAALPLTCAACYLLLTLTPAADRPLHDPARHPTPLAGPAPPLPGPVAAPSTAGAPSPGHSPSNDGATPRRPPTTAEALTIQATPRPDPANADTPTGSTTPRPGHASARTPTSATASRLDPASADTPTGLPTPRPDRANADTATASAVSPMDSVDAQTSAGCIAPPLTPVHTEPSTSATPSPSGAADTERSGGRGAWAGVALIFRLPAVRIPVLVAAVAIAMSGLTNAAVLAHIVDDLHLPSTRLGIVTSAQGAGSILSGLLVGRLLARFGPARVAALGAALFGAGRLAWALPWFPPAIAGSLVIGLGLPWTLIAGITAIQTETPDHLLGRVAASSNTVMFGPVALAIPLGSALVHLGALPPTLIATGLSFAAAIFGTRAHRTPGRARPAAHPDEPAPSRTPSRANR